MLSVKDHYENVLSDVYDWLFGGHEENVEKNRRFFQKHNIIPSGSRVAVDLGAGTGFQSIPLSEAGFDVTAIDISENLLDVIRKKSGSIRAVNDDLMNFQKYCDTGAELFVCMTDVLVHLESKGKVVSLFEKMYESLEENGKVILTFRDLSYELEELDRIIPVRSDDSTIFTCFLEYEPETVKVHDIIYTKSDRGWKLIKGSYRKLRVSKEWVEEKLADAGFTITLSTIENGFVTLVARK